MSSYSSKSQKRSKSQSKNGGRRKKRTLKNVRRRKSRKVMRGGAVYMDVEQLNKLFQGKDELKQQLFSAYNVTDFKGMMKLNNDQFNTNMISSELGRKGYDATSELVTLLRGAT